MTVSSQTSKVSYSGNGSTTTFTVSFYFLDNTHLKVIKTSASGIDTTLVLNTDYTVSGAGVSTGGSITCTIAPASGEKITIARNVPLTQETDYQANDPFPAESHERALDKLTMEMQQLNESNTRAIRVPVSTSTGVNTELPYPQANTVMGWDDTGTSLVNRDPADFAAVLTYANWLYDTFTGDGTTTSFAIQKNPANIANIDVTIDGVTQVPIADFSISGTTLTFASAPPSGSVIFARYGQASPQAAANFTVATATATANQTVFNLSTTYNPGSNNLAVYVNGLLMTPGVDYSETNSATVTFTKGLTVGDEVVFQCGRTLNDGYDSANVSFLQSGTGAVARTTQSKLRETVSVKDFGAVGDGVTDDTAAVQAALNSIYSVAKNYRTLNDGVCLYFPEGVYKCGALTFGPTVQADRFFGRIYFKGERGASVILSTVTGSQVALKFNKWALTSAFSNTLIEGISFRSANYAGIGLQFDALNYHVRVTKCVFHGFDYNFVNYSGISTVVDCNTFEAAKYFNYWSTTATTGDSGLDQYPTSLRFVNNVIGWGFSSAGATPVISGNGIGGTANVGGTGYHGLGNQAVIDGNIFEGITSASISNVPMNATVSRNWFENKDSVSTATGTAIWGEFFWAEISNNFFSNYGGGQLFNLIGNSLTISTNHNNIFGNYGISINDASYSKFRDLETNVLKASYLDVNTGGAFALGAGVVGAVTTANGYQFICRDTTAAAGRLWHFGMENGAGNSFTIYNGANAGVYMTYGGTSWTANSDERIKDIIEPIENAAEKVASLRAVIGKYKNDEEGTRRSFLIAQDVQAVLPEAVNVQDDDQGTLGLQYTDVIPLLVAAIKEQQTTIEQLKADVAALKQ